ncbi:DEAD/DEAH box helicase family protein [Desulfobacterales bacterium HSG17]|nr:DEAD/DEAH box helicase family protein [Desulfobacterales bacterium HSG17]
MKIKFNPDLNYQKQAIDSITALFEGQEICKTSFTVIFDKQQALPGQQNDLGIGNRLQLLEDEILENVQKIQLKNGLAQTGKLDENNLNFTVEMETGTGKTYVYLRSIFEMNRQYGFTKFIIVVPSLAVKEGVYKALQITEEHFKTLYDNIPFDYFVYDSQKLGQVRSFATSDTIQIMVINIDAFRKSFTDPSKETKANIIHRANDRMSGTRPIEFIQDTNPVVIIDEPQSVDTTPKSQKAIKSLNPLCCLRYSATHKDKYNLMYKLDSIDAYDQKLVKQIEVASINVKDGHNKAYIKLLSTDNKKSPISARIEFDALKTGKVKRVKKKVKSGDDLLTLSGGRDVYDGYVINDIYCEKGSEYIDFTSKPDIIHLNHTIGDVNEDEYKRLQIRKTIEEHLEKELKLGPKGIKVLSLFFIDKVANYRIYDKDGNPQKGKYALMFEEEYKEIIKKPKYNTLFKEVDTDTIAEQVHNGYFAIDKKKDATGKGRFKESTKGNALADENAYNLIMKDKEKLLGFDSKLKFIFSHSALKEGWDNPNVFQICTLNETASVIKKRQEIGRGLRIAVNQDGERVQGFDVNTLTVMANESYEDFAKQLQKEIEQEEGIKFGIIEKHSFANIPMQTETGDDAYLGTETSEKLWEHLLEKEYIDNKGKIQDSLRKDLKEDKVDLPQDLEPHAGPITSVLKKIAGKLNIKNADERKRIRLNKAVYIGEDFKNLWNRIKYKTTFRVNFDPESLIEKCAQEIKENLIAGKTRFQYSKGLTKIERSGVNTEELKTSQHVYDANDFNLPDIIGHLQNETNLKRETLAQILIRSKKLKHFCNNPQKFMDQASAIIKSLMRQFIVDGIKYEKIGNDHFYAQELFEEEELMGYLNKNMMEAQKSVFDHVVYDSEIESEFAKAFELSQEVKVYAKLPGWFKIETPLGSYNPDWAVLIDREDREKLYFVIESKGSVLTEMLRPAEKAKIDCGKKHFKALDSEVEFTVASSFGNFEGSLV